MDIQPLQSLLLVAVLVCLQVSAQAARVEESPSAFEMMRDLVVAFPIGITWFALGSVTFVATLPFALLGGNAGEAGKVLVVDTAKAAFVRCLGCSQSGRKETIRD
ncbi:MAG: hypothetical protein WD601_03385 [Pseudohongiellaceae bacterium]